MFPRLSLYHFLQFYSLGTAIPVFSIYFLDTLGFSSAQAGIILACGAGAAMTAPLLTTTVADRAIGGGALFGILNIFSGIALLFMLSFHDFFPVLIFYTIFMLAKVPTFALTNSVTFAFLSDRERTFPLIRLWGTIGFMSAAWTLSILKIITHIDFPWGFGLQLAALASLAAGLYAFTLPKYAVHQDQKEPKKRGDFKKALASLPHGFWVFLAVAFIITAIDRLYFFGAALFLEQAGVPSSSVLSLMTIGQVAEVIAMVLMGRFHGRLGFRKIFLAGVGLQALRFGLLSLAGVTLPLILVAISLHGLAFTFFFSNSYMYIDALSTSQTRARNQQLLTFLIEGVGVIAGNLLAGYTAQAFTTLQNGAPHINFVSFWAVPSLVAVVAGLVLFFLFGKHPKKTP